MLRTNAASIAQLTIFMRNLSPFSKSGSSFKICAYVCFAFAVTVRAVLPSRPKMAVRFFRNEAANTAHMPVCIGIYFMAYASCGLPHHVFSEYDAGGGLRTLTKL